MICVYIFTEACQDRPIGIKTISRNWLSPAVSKSPINEIALFHASHVDTFIIDAFYDTFMISMKQTRTHE